MCKQLLFLFLVLFGSLSLAAQDSSAVPPTLPADSFYEDQYIQPETAPQLLSDSINNIRLFHPNALSTVQSPGSARTWLQRVYAANNWIGFTVPDPVQSHKRQVKDKDLLFYVLAGILLFFALLRAAFPKYMADLFRLFFRTTLKQRQISEQLLANPVPSLLLNLFFLVTGGLYICFLLFYFEISPVRNFWLMYGYSALVLLGIYLGKFIALKLMGWIFGLSRLADSYIFVVFMINKVLGIFLLPFVIGLGFTKGNVFELVLTLSFFGVAGLLLYRIVFSYRVVRGQIRLNPLYFFLYLCAFEVAPLFLIYKLIIPVF